MEGNEMDIGREINIFEAVVVWMDEGTALDSSFNEVTEYVKLFGFAGFIIIASGMASPSTLLPPSRKGKKKRSERE